MKKFTQKFLSAVILITAISFTSNATNVSGGIYTNTIWTLANSPYIVVDTVVVFPGVTLTIEPGVVVKFDDHKRLDIRGSLIASGTAIDSITFTSNSLTPVPGIHAGINLLSSDFVLFEYCNLFYAGDALDGGASTILIKHSNFKNNITGSSAIPVTNGTSEIDSSDFSNNALFGCYLQEYTNFNYCSFLNNWIGLNTSNSVHGYTVKNCIISYNHRGLMSAGTSFENCIINSNDTGIQSSGNTFLNCTIDSNSIIGIRMGVDSVLNCQMKYNRVAMVVNGGTPALVTGNIFENDSIGLQGVFLSTFQDHFYCNKFCNNYLYDVYYTYTSNNSLPNNYWCTNDSATISAHIYDGYDDVSYGLINFMPIDTIGCYLTGCNLQISATVTNATCDNCHNGSATAHIANGFAPYTYTWFTSPIQSTQTATGLASGTYTVCVADAHGCTACNSGVFVDSSNCTGFSVHANAVNATCSTCSDGSATVSITGGNAPFNYTWYTLPIQTTATATGIVQGIYSVCVSDLYGCSACDSFQVSTGNCSAHFNLYPDTIIHHYYAVNMASGVAPLSYSWDWGDGSPADTIPYPAHTYASAGYYTICLTITDSVGCMNTYCNSFYLMSIPNPMVYVNVIPQSNTGISEKANDQSILVFPNPFSDRLTLLLPEKDSKAKIKIYNLLGETELYSSVEAQKSNLDVSTLSKGIYILEIICERKTINKKIVKQ